MLFVKEIINKKQDGLFFVFLFALLLFIFRKAFLMNYFLDDYFFLKISDAHSLSDFLNFFSPFRTYSYKPLAVEVFYFIIHLFNNSAFLAHIIVFSVYFIGLYFLYKVFIHLTKNRFFSRLAVFLYAINFTHVFHLYYLGTFQEPALFTSLVISFYFFLKRKTWWGITFYVLALLTKETAILYFPFLIVFLFIYQKKKFRQRIIVLSAYFLVSVVFYFLYSTGLNHVTELEQYKLHYDIKFVLNNFLWYFVWGIGGANFLPDYFPSIFGLPIPKFWKVIQEQGVLIYFGSWFVYLFTFLASLIFYLHRKSVDIKPVVKNFVYTVCGFFLFLGPILFFSHQWMLRLMLPLIFLSLFQAYILFKFISTKGYFLKLGMFLIVLYVVTNFFGIIVHESSSTYLLENKIFQNAKTYFATHRNEILKYDIVYFKDTVHNLPQGWNGSEKLKNSLNGNNFLYYFFPEKRMSAVYDYEKSQDPKGAYTINSSLFLK